MDIKIINESQKNLWDKYVETHPKSIAWQAYDWSKVLKKHYSVQFFPIAAFSKSKICGILPLYAIKTFLKPVKFISVPHAVAGGILADTDEITSELLKYTIDFVKAKGGHCITFKQYKYKIENPLRTDENYYNRELSLSSEINSIYDGFALQNKFYLDYSQKYDIELVHPDSDSESFFKLVSIYNKNMGIPCDGKSWIKDLIDFGMYSTALLVYDDRIVAGTMVKKFKNTVSFPFTCIPNESETSLMFAYRLYWELIKKFAAEGFKIFHSGRIPITNKAAPFRLGWGGEKYTYYYQYYPASTKITEYSQKHNPKRVFFQTVWKHLPVTVTSTLGPVIKQYFP